jgi:hypothetical protein
MSNEEVDLGVGYQDALRDEDCPWPYKPITHSNYFQCGIIISNTWNASEKEALKCFVLVVSDLLSDSIIWFLGTHWTRTYMVYFNVR